MSKLKYLTVSVPFSGTEKEKQDIQKELSHVKTICFAEWSDGEISIIK